MLGKRTTTAAPDLARLGSFASLCKCPITTQLMLDPVVAQDGVTYERAAIERWLRAKRVSPVTRARIGEAVVPHIALRGAVEELVDAGGFVADERAEWLVARARQRCAEAARGGAERRLRAQRLRDASRCFARAAALWSADDAAPGRKRTRGGAAAAAAAAASDGGDDPGAARARRQRDEAELLRGLVDNTLERAALEERAARIGVDTSALHDYSRLQDAVRPPDGLLGSL